MASKKKWKMSLIFEILLITFVMICLKKEKKNMTVFFFFVPDQDWRLFIKTLIYKKKNEMATP